MLISVVPIDHILHIVLFPVAAYHTDINRPSPLAGGALDFVLIWLQVCRRVISFATLRNLAPACRMKAACRTRVRAKRSGNKLFLASVYLV